MSFGHFEAATGILSTEGAFEAMQEAKRVLSGVEKQKWDDIKIQVMKALLFLKFSENEDAKNILLSTGQSELIESTLHPFWGGERGGANMHGRLLMDVRTMFQTGQSFNQNICIGDSILKHVISESFMTVSLRGATRIEVFRLCHLFLAVPGVQRILIHVGTNDLAPWGFPRGSPASAVGELPQLFAFNFLQYA